MFVLGDIVVVVVSVGDADPPWVMGMTGQVDGNRFGPAAAGRLDAGHRFYAPQSLTMADGRRVAFGWVRVTTGGVEITEGGRRLTEAAGPPRTARLGRYASTTTAGSSRSSARVPRRPR